MIKQNVFIFNHYSLYEILDEIKVNLSFDIIMHENEVSLFKDKNFNIKNSLIISKSNNKINLNKNLDIKNIINFHDYPIKLNRLIELINIQLIKIKFNHQSKVIVKDYELDLNSKNLSKDHLILKLTEKEIEIILYLSKDKNKHNVMDLQKNIWGYVSDMETHTVETHVYRLRKKIFNKFNEDSFILSHPDGYFIN
jgi:hypothetical protein|tara:strand:- start:565 stop:1152 length:588 start_codon:yes stop_codon:yes gene_type:complete